MSNIPDQVFDQHVAVLGKTGSGKTSTEKLAIEQAVAKGFRVCVLDSVKSDWWGITSSANGHKPGLPFQILGGPHGHVPLHSSAGKIIGQLVGSGKLPLSIIDMADFEAGGLQRFFIDFAQSLMRSAKGVVYLVLEEAHEFAPKERSGIGAENMAIHWAKKLATAGRSKGIRLIVATQRIQALHNAVLGSCETLIAHRISAPADQEPVTKWLRANTDKATAEKVMGSLSSLPTGTGWVCSGEAKIFEMIKFKKFNTYDNTATPTGDGGEVNIKTAPVDQEALRAIIGDAVQEAEANDPVKLKEKIRQLQKQIGAPVVKIDNKVVEEAWRKGKVEGFKDGVKSVYEDIKGRVKMAKNALDGITEIQVNMPKIEPEKVIPQTKFSSAPTPVFQSSDNDELSGPEIRIMDSMQFWISRGNSEPTRDQVAGVAGYSSGGGSFIAALSGLRTKGYVQNASSGTLSILKTHNGSSILSDKQARDKLLSILGSPHKRLIENLDTDPKSREEVATGAGYTAGGGSFIAALSKLSTLGVIEKPSTGMLNLSSWAAELLS